MPNGNKVRPHKWENIIDLYDDEEYSAIWGFYDGNKGKLGVRWNGGLDVGFPHQGKYSLWYIEPEYLVKNILHIEIIIAMCKNKINSINFFG